MESSGNDEIPSWLKARVHEALPDTGYNLWVPGGTFMKSSLVRVLRFPKKIDENKVQELKLEGVRNEQISAQLAVASTDSINNLQVSVDNLTSRDGTKISSGSVQVRFVKFMPVEKVYISCYDDPQVETVAGRGVSGDRNPDVVGDPLLEKESVDVPDYRTQPIWFTFNISDTAKPGVYNTNITISNEREDPARKIKLNLKINDTAIPNPEDCEFFSEYFLNYSAVAGYYGVELWSQKHWDLLKQYMDDLASHGQKVIETVITEKPWPIQNWMGKSRPQTEFGYESLVKWRYDGEDWSFNYSLFDQDVQTALDQGMGPRVSVFSLLPFRGEPKIVYMDERKGKIVEEKMKIGSDRWREVWSIFLKDFSKHQKSQGWLDQTYISFDERPAELMEKVLQLVKNATPELVDHLFVSGAPEAEPYSPKFFSVAYSYLPGNTDAPEKIGKMLEQRRKEDQTTVYYTACGPAHPNNFMFSPAAESRMLPWIAAKYKLDGYIRWAYNSWPSDVFESPVFRYVEGDEYFVYPGKKGPISSIRWELYKEGIEEYELITKLRKQLTDKDNELLQQSIELATRNKDARQKDLTDFIKARNILVNEILEN